jgi:hypothetical protein
VAITLRVKSDPERRRETDRQKRKLALVLNLPYSTELLSYDAPDALGALLL